MPCTAAHQAVDSKDVDMLVEVVGKPSLLPLYPQIEWLVRMVCVHIRVSSVDVGEDVVAHDVLQAAVEGAQVMQRHIDLSVQVDMLLRVTA